METKRQFISWRRVSTQKQGRSGLGLEAQASYINYFVNAENGELIADFTEVYTGKALSGCTELRKAIALCKETGATLIIAKTDRFRNTAEALQIVEEVGEDRIFFCDLPHTDKFTLTMFFALAEREALLDSIRTKQALAAKKERGESTGGNNELWGKNTGSDRAEALRKANEASARSKREKAMANPNNRAFREFIEDWEMIYGKITANTDFQPIADKLNERGKTTATGLPFTANRARAMYDKIRTLYA